MQYGLSYAWLRMYVLCIRLVHIRVWPHDLGVIMVMLLIISPHGCNPAMTSYTLPWPHNILHISLQNYCATFLWHPVPHYAASHRSMAHATFSWVSWHFALSHRFTHSFNLPSLLRYPHRVISLRSPLVFFRAAFWLLFVLYHIFSRRDCSHL